MLAERSGAVLTLSALAAEAQVSRRTLYVHWGTIQQVIGDAVSFQYEQQPLELVGLSPRDRLKALLTSIRAGIHDPASNVALATMLSSAAQSDTAAEVVRATGESGYKEFVTLLGPTTPEQYAQLIGPLVFAEFIGREPASDALVDELVQRGIELLGLGELADVAELPVLPAFTS